MFDIMTNTKVLKLNKNYSPLEVITARDAFEMLVSERAEVITVEEGNYTSYDFESWAEISQLRRELEEYTDLDDWVYTSFLTLQIPRVVRSLTYMKMPVVGTKLNRRNIYARDNNICQYCGDHFKTKDLTIDHVTPKSKGGHNTWTNLVCACFGCNQKKSNKTLKESRMHLLKRPVKPGSGLLLKVDNHKKYYDWSHFISDNYWNVELID